MGRTGRATPARGAEALDLLQALNTGHEGSLSTIHANSPADALRRLETLALMAGVGLPHDAIRDQVTGALDLVVQQERGRDGRRRITAICEIDESGGARALLDGGGDRLGDPSARLAARLDRIAG